MKKAILLVFVVATPVAADDPKDPVKAEVKKLQGTWKFTSLTASAEAVDPDVVKNTTWVIEGTKITVWVEKRKHNTWEFTVDPSKDPKAIDMTVTDGAGKGRRNLGIYKLDGDTLSYCFDRDKHNRPTTFEAKMYPNRRVDELYEFKRQK